MRTDGAMAPDSPRQHFSDAIGAGTFGMILFLMALSMIFGATILGYLYIRSLTPAWPPPGSPPLPAGLWLSTAFLLLVSGAMHWALRSVRWDRQASLRRALLAAGGLALLFLANQAYNWSTVKAALLPPGSPALRYTSTFYILTGTHALHVAGGLIVLAIVTRKAFRGDYSSVYHPGVRYSAMYWHYLDAVWLVLFTVLLAT